MERLVIQSKKIRVPNPKPGGSTEGFQNMCSTQGQHWIVFDAYVRLNFIIGGRERFRKNTCPSAGIAYNIANVRSLD
jgi:hypothetical protein